MIIFTWDDLKRLLISKQRKIIRWSVLCAIFAFLAALTSPLQYEAYATFKQSASGIDQNFDLKNLIRTFSSRGAEGSSSTLMLSDTVLEKTILQLGLQAELKTKPFLSRLLSRIGEKALGEAGIKSQDEDLPSFSSVIYSGESPLSLKFRRISETEYELFDSRHQFLKTGLIGEPVVFDDFQFTLESLPSSIACLQEAALQLTPLQPTTTDLRKKIAIKTTRDDKNLLLIKCRDIHRKRSAEIVNTLMAMYERHLIEENKVIIGAQLSYLRQRQDELSAKLDQDILDHAKALKQNLQTEGFLGIKDEVAFILEPLQTHQLRLDEVEVELRQIDHRLAKANLDSKWAANKPKLVERYSNLLAEQIDSARNLLAQVRRKEPMTLPSSLENLQPIAQEFNQALQTDEPTLQNKKQEVETTLNDLIEHLASRERSLREGSELMKSLENDFSGIRLESARSLFDHYSRQFDELYAQLKQVIFIREHLFDPRFEISTLSNVLADPVTQQMVQRSSDLETQLCDDVNRSVKDRQRLKTTLAIHKRFLDSHLEQTLQLGKIRIELIKEKISSLYTVMKTLLEQEKNVLHEKISELKLSLQALPDLWVHENRLKFKSELTQGMMEGLVNIAETKNLSHYLYQVESKPLDKAKAPFSALHPFIVLKTTGVFVLASFALALFFLIQSLLRGIPVSLITLSQLGEHTSGSLSLRSPLTLDSVLETDQKTLRRIVSFLMEPQESFKKVVSVIGEKQTNFFPALTALLKKHHFSSCVVDCSFGKIVSKEEEGGLLQSLKGAPLEPYLRFFGTYDFLPIGGGGSIESVELLKSTAFQKVIQELASRYDYLFLLSRTSIDSLEAEALIHQTECAIVVAETSLEQLKLSRQKEKNHVTFIQYPIFIEI